MGTCIQHLKFFLFLLQKWCSTPKTGGHAFAQVNVVRAGAKANSKSSGRWNQKRSGWGGLTQAMGKAGILPISTDAGELAQQAGALIPVKLLQRFLALS